MISDTWVERYLQLAKHIASWSKDPSRTIGAVAIGSKGQVLSQGYNGFPRGIFDDARYEHRETKYKYVVHAEMNVIYNASYSGVSLDGSSFFVYGLPVCSECAKGIIQVGAKEVFILTEEVVPDIWDESFKLSKSMLNEASVHVEWRRK
jgi:dCMP deaminase